MTRVLKEDKGFTLIEIIAGIVLIAIIASITGVIFYYGVKPFVEEDVRKDLTTQGRLTIERMVREMRLIRCSDTTGNRCRPDSTDITNWTSGEIRFVNINYEGRGFRAGGGKLYMRQGSGGGDPEYELADNINSLTFGYYDKDGNVLTPGVSQVKDIWTIVANLSLTKGEQSMDFRIQIHPRGFRQQ